MKIVNPVVPGVLRAVDTGNVLSRMALVILLWGMLSLSSTLPAQTIKVVPKGDSALIIVSYPCTTGCATTHTVRYQYGDQRIVRTVGPQGPDTLRVRRPFYPIADLVILDTAVTIKVTVKRVQVPSLPIDTVMEVLDSASRAVLAVKRKGQPVPEIVTTVPTVLSFGCALYLANGMRWKAIPCDP